MIILFDGVCHLCDATVKFILPRDRAGVFRFATLQSDFARNLLGKHGLPVTHPPQTIFLVDGGEVYDRSTAALRIACRLGGAWRLLAAFWIIPKPLRDWVYALIALNRYRWFGRYEECPLPPADWKARFIE